MLARLRDSSFHSLSPGTIRLIGMYRLAQHHESFPLNEKCPASGFATFIPADEKEAQGALSHLRSHITWLKSPTSASRCNRGAPTRDDRLMIIRLHRSRDGAGASANAHHADPDSAHGTNLPRPPFRLFRETISAAEGSIGLATCASSVPTEMLPGSCSRTPTRSGSSKETSRRFARSSATPADLSTWMAQT